MVNRLGQRLDRIEDRINAMEIRIDGGPVSMRGDDTDDGTIEKFGARLDAIAGHLGISV